MQPELKLNFLRASETLTLELRHDLPTAEFLVIMHRSDGEAETDNVDRFGDVDQAMAYLRFVEGRLGDDDWIRTETPPAEAEAEMSDDTSEVAEETPDESSERPDAQLYRIKLPPLPAPEEAELTGFPEAVDDPFPEESPFATESPLESQSFSAPVEVSGSVAAAAAPAEPPVAPAPGEGEAGGATYALDRPLYCPHCREWIRTILVVRLSRMQVPFTSTLPRSGRALACTACHGVLSLELSGFGR